MGILCGIRYCNFSGNVNEGFLVKVVLHIGMPKNGSTSIQVNFMRNHEKLKSHGLLMPLVKERFIHPYHLNALLFAKNLEKAAANRPKIGEALEAIDAAAAEEPGFLFLSSEDFAHGYTRLENLERNLQRWSIGLKNVKVVAYMRDPVSLYRSIVQHHVKSQHYVPSPREWSTSYLDVLKSWRSKFGDRFTVVEFDRNALFKGSIVDDMVYRCDPQVAEIESFDTVVANVSEVSEVSAVMQSYMLEYQPNKKSYGTANSNLRAWLSRVAKEEKVGTKCKLRDEVAETILAVKRNEIFELRDEYGLSFGAIDYEALLDANVHEPCLDHDKVEDLCKVDHNVIANLTNAMHSRYLSDSQN